MEIDEEGREFLCNAALHGGRVDLKNLLTVADLMRAGFVEGETDYDVIKIEVTRKGIDFGISEGLFTPEDLWCFPRPGRAENVINECPQAEQIMRKHGYWEEEMK